MLAWNGAGERWDVGVKIAPRVERRGVIDIGAAPVGEIFTMSSGNASPQLIPCASMNQSGRLEYPDFGH